MSATTLSPVFSYGRHILDEFQRRDNKPAPVLDPRIDTASKEIAALDAQIAGIQRDLEAEQQNCSALQAEYDKSTDRGKMAHLLSQIQVSKSIMGRSQAELQREQGKRQALAGELSALKTKYETALADFELSHAIDQAKAELREIDARILQDLKRRREITTNFRYTKFYSENNEKRRQRLEDFAAQAASLFEFSVLATTLGQVQGISHIGAGFSRFFSVQNLKF